MKRSISVLPFFIFLPLLVIILLCRHASGGEAASGTASIITIDKMRMHSGDSDVFKLPGYDDEQWDFNAGRLWVVSGSGRGVQWYRALVTIGDEPDSLSPLALYCAAAVSAAEFYWDGRIIGKSGRTGILGEPEIPGQSSQLFMIPSTLAGNGEHVLAIRVANRTAFSGTLHFPLLVGPFQAVRLELYRTAALQLFLAGVFIVAAFFHIALLFGQMRKTPYILFSLFSICCGLYILIESWLLYFSINLRYYFLLAGFNDIPWFFMMVLLPIFFAVEFELPRRRLLAIIVSIVALVVMVPSRFITVGLGPASWLIAFSIANQVHLYATMFMSLLICSWACSRRISGSLIAVVGLFLFCVGVVITWYRHLAFGWSLGFAALIIMLAISLALRMARQRRDHQESLLRAARLESDLLKKHIQPHFLLNTLNSILGWLEEKPAVASRLVTALAGEFRMLMASSKQSMTSLSDEIELCKTHCEIMSLRQEKQFTFSATGVRGDEQVPPLIIHTLLENGLTHGYEGRFSGHFELTVDHRENGLWSLSLFNDSEAVSAKRQIGKGTGTRYIESRLQAQFPGKWTFSTAADNGGWRATITIGPCSAGSKKGF